MVRNRDTVMPRFSRQHRIDRSANAFRGFIFWVHGPAIDVQGWSDLYSERFATRMIGIDSCFGFFAIHVFFKLINIQSDRARVRFEQFSRIRGLAPGRLFAIQRVVHLPKITLEPAASAASEASRACS